MAEQDRKATARPTPKDEAGVTANPRVADKGERLKKTMDEIDAVLEENAEEFVKTYVQRGGE